MEKEKKLSPLKAIKNYCKEECCAGDNVSWRECDIKRCPLLQYRMGKKIKKV